MFRWFQHRRIYCRYDGRIQKKRLKISFRYEDEIVIEPYIKGREFAVGIIDGKALPVIEIIPKTGFFDYANNIRMDAQKKSVLQISIKK
mgnify:CR=1 FL=1